MKHTKITCPKSDTWFIDGGKCGWAHECDECEEYVNEKKGDKMSTIKVKVEYNAIPDIIPELDDAIRSAMELAGLEWYAQGVEVGTGKRDICFDWPVPEDRCVNIVMPKREDAP